MESSDLKSLCFSMLKAKDSFFLIACKRNTFLLFSCSLKYQYSIALRSISSQFLFLGHIYYINITFFPDCLLESASRTKSRYVSGYSSLHRILSRNTVNEIQQPLFLSSLCGTPLTQKDVYAWTHMHHFLSCFKNVSLRLQHSFYMYF